MVYCLEFRVNDSEADRMLVIIGMILYTPLESQDDDLKGLVNLKKLLRQFNRKSCNEFFFFF